MKKMFFFLISVFIFGAYTIYKNIETKAKKERIFDIAYGSLPSSKMNLFLPENRNGKTPFIIFIHGGSWLAGDKNDLNDLQNYTLMQGIASANINYRSVDDKATHFTQLLADIDSAITYCISHAEEWKTRNTKFTLSGFSAGAHLALLSGYTTSKQVSAIIALSPVTDLTDIPMWSQTELLPVIYKLTGSTFTEGRLINPEFSAASPIFHIKNIPTLLIYGSKDVVVPPNQSLRLQQKLNENKFKNKVISIPGAPHNLNILEVPATRLSIYNALVDWTFKYGK